MNRKPKRFLLSVALILLFLLVSAYLWHWCLAGPRKPGSIPPGDYTYTLDYAEYRIEKVMKQKHLPGLAVVLVDDQDIVWQENFGLANLEENSPVEPDTIFRLWSVAKAITAIETLGLVEDGLVNLDTSITEYLTDFSIRSRFPDSGPITIRSILTHRAGLPRNGCYQLGLTLHVLADIAASLADCYQAYPVGYRYKYSNAGFDLLGKLVEDYRGKPFAEYMRDDFLLPIGMTNSAFLRSQLPSSSKLAPGYEYWEGKYYPYEQGDITSLPSGNLYSTIEDMGKFVQFIFREGEANGAYLINPATLKAMFVEQATDASDPQPMGLGWKTARVLGSELLIWHDGGPSEGTGAMVAFLPERKLGVVLIANGTTFEGGVSVPLAVEILGSMLEAKSGPTTAQEEPHGTSEIDRGILDYFTGRYIVFGEVMDVLLEGDQLKGSLQGFSFNLDPLDGRTFQPHNWLSDTGLGGLLGAPVDLRLLKINFVAGDAISPDYLIIDLGGFSYEICPKYPDFDEILPLWNELEGDYDLVARLPSGQTGTDVLGQSGIYITDGVLEMAGSVGPLLPISDTQFVILSGPFAGETMIYEPGTGRIFHQNIVFLEK